MSLVRARARACRRLRAASARRAGRARAGGARRRRRAGARVSRRARRWRTISMRSSAFLVAGAWSASASRIVRMSRIETPSREQLAQHLDHGAHRQQVRDQLLDDLRVLLAGDVEQLLRLAAAEQVVRVAADELGEVGRDHRGANRRRCSRRPRRARAPTAAATSRAGRTSARSVASPGSARVAVPLGSIARTRWTWTSASAIGTPESSTRYAPGRMRRSSRMWTAGTMMPSSPASCLRSDAMRLRSSPPRVGVDHAQAGRGRPRATAARRAGRLRSRRAATFSSGVRPGSAALASGRVAVGSIRGGCQVLRTRRRPGGNAAEPEEQEVRHPGQEPDHAEERAGDRSSGRLRANIWPRQRLAELRRRRRGS